MKKPVLATAFLVLGLTTGFAFPLQAAQRERPPTVLHFPEIPRDSAAVQSSTLEAIEEAFREAKKPEACDARDSFIQYLVFSPIRERIDESAGRPTSKTFRQLLQQRQRLYIVCASPGNSATGLWYQPALNNYLTDLRAMARQLGKSSSALRDGRILGPEDLPILTQMAGSADEILKSPGHDLEPEDFTFLNKLLGNDAPRGEPSWESFFLSGLDNGFSLLVSNLASNRARLHLLSGMRSDKMFSIALDIKDTISLRRIALNLRDVRRILANSKVRIPIPAMIDGSFNVQDLVFSADPCTAFQPIRDGSGRQLFIEADCPGRVIPKKIEVSLRSPRHCMLRRWQCSDSMEFRYPDPANLMIVPQPEATRRLELQGTHLHTYLLSRQGLQFPDIDDLLAKLEGDKDVLSTFFLSPRGYFDELRERDLISRMGLKRQEMLAIELSAVELEAPLKSARQWIELVLSLRSVNEAATVQLRGQVASRSKREQRKAADVFTYIERYFETAFADRPSVEVELLTLVAPTAANNSKVRIDLYFPPKAPPQRVSVGSSLVAVP